MDRHIRHICQRVEEMVTPTHENCTCQHDVLLIPKNRTTGFMTAASDADEWNASEKGRHGIQDYSNRNQDYKPVVFRPWFSGILIFVLVTTLALMEVAVHLLPDGTQAVMPVVLPGNSTGLRASDARSFDERDNNPLRYNTSSLGVIEHQLSSATAASNSAIVPQVAYKADNSPATDTAYLGTGFSLYSTILKSGTMTCFATDSIEDNDGLSTITVPIVTVTVTSGVRVTPTRAQSSLMPTLTCDTIITSSETPALPTTSRNFSSGPSETWSGPPGQGPSTFSQDYITVGQNTVTITVRAHDEGAQTFLNKGKTTSCDISTVTVTDSAEVVIVTTTVTANIPASSDHLNGRYTHSWSMIRRKAQLGGAACLEGGMTTVTEHIAIPRTVTVTIWQALISESQSKTTSSHTQESDSRTSSTTNLSRIVVMENQGTKTITTSPTTLRNAGSATTSVDIISEAHDTSNAPQQLGGTLAVVTRVLTDSEGHSTLTTSIRAFIIPQQRTSRDSQGNPVETGDYFILNYPRTTILHGLGGDPSRTVTYYVMTASEILTNANGEPTATSVAVQTKTLSTATVTDSVGSSSTNLVFIPASFPPSTKSADLGPKPTTEVGGDFHTVLEVYSITQFEYFAGLILPTLIATLLTIPFRVFDHVVKLYHPFHVLAITGIGAPAGESISCETMGIGTIITRVRCLLQGEFLMSITGTLTALSAILVPISAETIRIILQGENCQRGQGDPENCAITVGVFPIPARIAISLLSMLSILTLASAVTLRRYRTGIYTKPWSFSAMADISTNPEFVLLLNHMLQGDDGAMEEQALRLLSARRYALDHWQDGPVAQYGVVPFNVSGLDIPTCCDPGIRYRPKHLGSRPRGKAPFLVLTVLGRSLALFVLLGMLIVIIVYNMMPRTTLLGQFLSSETLPLRVFVTSVGMFITFFWSSYSHCIAFLSPYRMIQNNPGKLCEAFDMNLPTNMFSGLYRSLLPASRDLYFAAVALTAILSEFLPALLSNMPYKVIHTWLTHTVCTWMTMGIISLMIVLIAASFFIDWPCPPLSPSTMIGAMCYVSQLTAEDAPDSAEDAFQSDEPPIFHLSAIFESTEAFEPTIAMEAPLGTAMSREELLNTAGSVFLVGSAGKIHRLPIPSDSPRDPLTWSLSKRLLALFALELYACVSHFELIIAGLLIGPVQLEFGQGPSGPVHVKAISAAMNLAPALGYVLAVPLSTAVGRRPVLIGAAVITCVSTLWAGLCGSFEQLITAIIFQGLATGGSITMTTLAIIDGTFIDERPNVLSFHWSLNQILIRIAMVALPLVFDLTTTWRPIYLTWFVLAMLAFIVIVAAFPETYFLRPAVTLDGTVFIQTASEKVLVYGKDEFAGPAEVLEKSRIEAGTPEEPDSDDSLRIDWKALPATYMQMFLCFMNPLIFWVGLLTAVNLSGIVFLCLTQPTALENSLGVTTDLINSLLGAGGIVGAIIAFPVTGPLMSWFSRRHAVRKGCLKNAEVYLFSFSIPIISGFLSVLLNGLAIQYCWVPFAFYFNYGLSTFSYITANVAFALWITEAFSSWAAAALAMQLMIGNAVSFGVGFGLIGSMDISIMTPHIILCVLMAILGGLVIPAAFWGQNNVDPHFQLTYLCLTRRVEMRNQYRRNVLLNALLPRRRAQNLYIRQIHLATLTRPPARYKPAMVVRRSTKRAAYGAVILLFLGTFIAYGPQLISRHRERARSERLLNLVYNNTLGFEKVFIVGLPTRTDRRDGMTLQASLSNIDLEFIDGLSGKSVPDNALPKWTKHERIPDASIGSWRAHLNAIREVVERNLTTALIMEDDADWDIRINSQLHNFALASQALSQPVVGLGLSHFAMSENANDAASDAISFASLPEVEAARISPYGDNWDVLWLGHCGAHFSFEDGPLPKARVIQLDDETVPKTDYLWSLSEPFTLKEVYPHHTRAYHHIQQGICSLSYAVSRKGALKILREIALRDVTEGYDLLLQYFCEGTHGMEKHTCITTQPALFQQHRPAGLLRDESDISDDRGEGFRQESMTRMLRWSVRLNAGLMIDGRTDYEDQYPDRVLTR
ncbi:hypothetical protein HJFPF1_02470 [Paramyrothecium foliicola]|nr:hypothetical protein HJFPF1_02470 [Paramyrothecium foliicola]